MSQVKVGFRLVYLYMKGFSLRVFGNWALRINSRLGYDFDFKSYFFGGY